MLISCLYVKHLYECLLDSDYCKRLNLVEGDTNDFFDKTIFLTVWSDFVPIVFRTQFKGLEKVRWLFFLCSCEWLENSFSGQVCK